MSRRNYSQSVCLTLLFFPIFAALLIPGALAQAASPTHTDDVKQSTAGNETQENQSPVVRQFVVPDMKKIFFCLAQALRFGTAG